MKVIIVTCLLMSVVFAADEPSSFQDCLENDSISCIQVTAYRKARSFFDQPTISIFEGLSLVKSKRTGKSLEEPTIEFESANTVETRENALESYVINRVKNFFEERSLSWDFANTARTVSLPLSKKKTDPKTEKIRAIKNFLRLLAVIKIKIFALKAIFAVLIAKKALLLAVIAIVVSGASLVQGLSSKLRGVGGGLSSLGGGLGSFGGGLGGFGGGNSGGHGGGHEEIIAYTNAGSGSGGWSSSGGNVGGWSAGGNSGGWNERSGYGEHGSHSSPVAESIAYSGHQKIARR